MVAGEASGDALGARLITALKQRHIGPLAFSGVGGAQMAAVGMDSLYPIADLSVMGLAEVLPRLRLLLQRLAETSDHVRVVQPAALITIDAPGFSLRLAKRLAGEGIPLIHYVAPQVWAWRPSRARHWAARIDHLLALLPFEPEFFREFDVHCEFVGHPVIEGLEEMPGNGAAFRRVYGVNAGAPLLALLPGSRVGEASRLLPIFAQAAAKLHKERPELHVVMPTVEQVVSTVTDAVKTWPMPVHVVQGPSLRADAFAAADAALAASGTVSLELALRGVPSVVAYRANPITAALVRRMLLLPYVALPNILAGELVMPEFLQENCQPAGIADALSELLDNTDRRSEQRQKFSNISEMLGRGGVAPSLRAAEAILRLLKAK